MGRRYRSILKMLNIKHISVDENDLLPRIEDKVTHYIIATPTESHLENVYEINWNDQGKSILIEKPVRILDDFHNQDVVFRPLEIAMKNGHTIYMVNQYAYYPIDLNEPDMATHYDYFNSGNDGIGWDCIQILHLAKGECTLLNESPYWICKINGVTLSKNVIDNCYVHMIEDFTSDGEKYGKLWGWDDIKEAHRKSYEYSDRCAGT